MSKFVGSNALLYFSNKMKTLLNGKVDKVEGKGLSKNDLTDELVAKINAAGESNFSGDYEDLTNKPTIPSIEGLAKSTDVTAEIATAVEGLATETYVAQQIANINKKEVVDSLDDMTDTNTIYLMSNEGTAPNVYDEYIIVNGNPEKIGTTEIDLSGYVKTSDLTEVTNAEIDAMFADGE